MPDKKFAGGTSASCVGKEAMAPPSNEPRMAESLLEKLVSNGAASLTIEELLAVAIAGSSEDVDRALPSARTLRDELGSVYGLGRVSSEALARAGLCGLEASRFLAAFELGRRAGMGGRGEVKVISSPEDVHALFHDEREEVQEHFYAVLLDSKNGVLSRKRIHTGTVSSSLVGIREFFREAVREGAASVIAVHNHPSGDPAPSKEDFEVTRALAEAGKLLDIPLLDHVIVARNGFTSMQRLGAI